MVKKTTPPMVGNTGQLGLLCTVTLWSTDVFADIGAFGQCTNETVLSLLHLVVVITLVSLVFEQVLREIVLAARLPRLGTVAKAIGKKLIPWIGAVVVLIQLIPLLINCVPLL